MRRRLIGERAFQGVRNTLSEYSRPGYIEDVNADRGTAVIRWLDHPGVRAEVLLSQSGPGAWEWPVRGQVVLVSQSRGERAHIVRYIPVGYAARAKRGDARALSAGEKLWESFSGTDEANNPIRTGTELYMNNRGDVLITTATGDYWKISRDENKIIQNSALWEVSTEAGRMVFGVMKRQIDNKTKIITKNNIPILLGGEVLTEFKLQVVNESDTGESVGIDDPIVEITLGTNVDSDGNVVLTSSAAGSKKTYVDISTKSSIGFRLSIDHDGKMVIEAKKMLFLSQDIKIGKNPIRANAAREGDNVVTIDPYSGAPQSGKITMTSVPPVPPVGTPTSEQVQISN